MGLVREMSIMRVVSLGWIFGGYLYLGEVRVFRKELGVVERDEDVLGCGIIELRE